MDVQRTRPSGLAACVFATLTLEILLQQYLTHNQEAAWDSIGTDPRDPARHRARHQLRSGTCSVCVSSRQTEGGYRESWKRVRSGHR